jgi:exosortase/archaeosortase family protein
LQLLNILNNGFIKYLVKFIICFCLLYYGTLAMIGFASPGGYYSPFIHNYVNYISLLRFCLLFCSKTLLTIFGYHVFIDGMYVIRMYNGSGVHLVYSCIGFGIMSFWIAFIFANNVSWQKKIKWMLGGGVLIFIINVIRISSLLIVINTKWSKRHSIDNHTLFNIIAYLLIFAMIYLFDRSEKHTNIIKSDNEVKN